MQGECDQLLLMEDVPCRSIADYVCQLCGDDMCEVHSVHAESGHGFSTVMCQSCAGLVIEDEEEEL